MRGVIFPLFVKARKLSIISCNHAPEMAKFQDEIMTSTTPEESKWISKYCLGEIDKLCRLKGGGVKNC